MPHGLLINLKTKTTRRALQAWTLHAHLCLEKLRVFFFCSQFFFKFAHRDNARTFLLVICLKLFVQIVFGFAQALDFFWLALELSYYEWITWDLSGSLLSFCHALAHTGSKRSNVDRDEHFVFLSRAVPVFMLNQMSNDKHTKNVQHQLQFKFLNKNCLFKNHFSGPVYYIPVYFRL